MRKFDIDPEIISDNDLLKVLNDDPDFIGIERYTFKNYLEKAKMKTDMKMMFGTYFQTGEICVLAGKTGVGKSILAYQIGDGISKGISILNQQNETEPQRVLYYDFELNEQNIKKRFFDYEPSENFFRPDVTDILLQNDGKFDFEIIANDIDRINASVVIIDNITAIALRSLQDQDTAMMLMQSAKKLNREKEISILLLAHTPKLKENKPLELYDISGSSHIHNFIDNAIMVGKSSQDLNRRYIKQVKSRNCIESDDVLIVDIVDQDWLHYEYFGYENENNHVQISEEKAEQTKEKYIKIAYEILNDCSLSYTDFCSKYSELYGKTIWNGKAVLNKLIRLNLIVKDAENRKYIINRNEIPF